MKKINLVKEVNSNAVKIRKTVGHWFKRSWISRLKSLSLNMTDRIKKEGVWVQYALREYYGKVSGCSPAYFVKGSINLHV
jgi:hypothetical protein